MIHWIDATAVAVLLMVFIVTAAMWSCLMVVEGFRRNGPFFAMMVAATLLSAGWIMGRACIRGLDALSRVLK